jgi:UDP-GlcNAc3NAcA epimerase
MTVLTVIGARPQFIKAGPVSRALAEAGIHQYLVHTGQHYDAPMSQVFFDELNLPAPETNLGVGSGSHAEQTAGMLRGLEQAITDRKPDWVLVYGDTNSTLAGALAAAKLRVPIAHVEAGLRSFNRRMPEEINRIVTDAVSELLFAPTPKACENLRREGVAADRIKLVGDVMYDAALLYAPSAEKHSTVLSRLGLQRLGYALVTIHRAENTDNPERLARIVEGIRIAAQITPVLWPVHPRTRTALTGLPAAAGLPAAVRMIEPVGYLDMIELERNASVIVTDSGGVQKEAFFYQVPCVTLRDETEWTELVEAGWNRLCPPAEAQTIAKVIISAIGSVGGQGCSYGGGCAASKIAEELLRRGTVGGAPRNG